MKKGEGYEKNIDRRAFLKFASFTGLLLSSDVLFAGKLSEEEIPQQPNRIDVHHHIVPPFYTSSLSKIGITKSGGVSFPKWDARRSIDLMDRNNIATAITSISSPGIYFGDIGFSKELARQCNEFSANLIKDHQKRFGGFAVLPLPDVQAALNELEQALDILKLDGVVILSNVDGYYPGAPRFDELYSELNKRKAVVFIHPTVPSGGKFPKMNMKPALIEFVFDTTRAISNLILSNTLERFPDIKFICAHAGGTAPYIASRISIFDCNAISLLKTMYYDTASSASPYAMRSLQELVDNSQILFGSDYPFAPGFLTSATISGLNEYKGFNQNVLQAINRNNALKLFPRFAAKEGK